MDNELRELVNKRLETMQQQKDAYEKQGKEFENFHLPYIKEAFTSGASKYIFQYGASFPNFYIPKNALGHSLFNSLKPVIKEYVYDRSSIHPKIMFEQIIFKSAKELQCPPKKSSVCVIQ